jgi:hypothetical protein
MLGVDRFYLGKVGSGLAKLFTAGGLGVWWLIDLVIVLAGRAKTKSGATVTPQGKQQLFAILITVVLVFVVGGRSASSSDNAQVSDASSPAATEVAETESPATESAAPTPDASQETETPEPSATPNDTPAGLEAFAFHAHEGVDDLLGNLDDIKARVETRSYLFVGGNVIQILMNQTYLEELTPPTKISKAWSVEVAKLGKTVDALNDAASGFIAEQTTKAETMKAIANVVNQAKKLDSVASKIG